jgi:RNA polymerase sigma-70 factor, ECF subfamily
VSGEPEAALTASFRDDWSWVVARLIGLTGDWDLAEDCTQEAFAVAVRTWRRDGVPDNPRAWLITTARNRAVDHIRRQRTGAAKLRELGAEPMQQDPMNADALQTGITDDRLRLIFTCCHPALAFEAQVALALRTLCGLSTAQIARAFLVTEPTMAKRLVRAKQKITTASIPYRVPPARLLPERTSAVLGVVYLLFNAGYAAAGGPALVRPALCAHAVDLARMVAELMPDDPEAAGLYALLLLLHARSAARTDPSGALVPLEEQDRSRWDAAMISTGVAVVQRALRREKVGPYQLQALIAACHASAATPAETDWAQITGLYDELQVLVPSSTVRLNRAVAIAMRDGPQAGLDLIDELVAAGQLGEHPLIPAVRADLLRRLGRAEQAAEHYRDALTRADNDAERAYLARRLQECGNAR